MTARERFRAAYRAAIERAVRERPGQYAAVAGQDLDAFTARWLLAVETGNYNHDGHAMRWTCKALGIPHTRKAITAFFAPPAVAPAPAPAPAVEPAAARVVDILVNRAGSPSGYHTHVWVGARQVAWGIGATEAAADAAAKAQAPSVDWAGAREIRS